MPTLFESHTNPNLGVTMRRKESLVVTDSRIVVFWVSEVKKSSSYDSESSKYTPIFSNITLSDDVVHGFDFSLETHSKMQEGAITVSTKEYLNIFKTGRSSSSSYGPVSEISKRVHYWVVVVQSKNSG